MLLYLQGQGGALRNEESNTGAHGCTPTLAGVSKARPRVRDLEKGPISQAKRKQFMKQEHSANGGDPACHRHMGHCVGWINTKLFFFLAAPSSLQDLSSSTRDQTLGSGSESAKC